MSWDTGKSKSKQPSKAAMGRVRKAFDADELKETCVTWDFTGHARRVELAPGVDGRERFYWHADNGSNILAVGHLDTVQDDRTCQVTDTAAGLLATSGGLDDRLGVYVILHMLPKLLGVKFDILLTTDEERGQSTAECFDSDKTYDWIVQFDRGGTDVVMYDYETRELCELVEKSGARVGSGSFSDICCLEHLGCAGVNWGVGYRDYHSPRSHAWLEDTFRMVARFEKFYRANKDVHLHYEQRPWDWWKGKDCDDGMEDGTRDGDSLIIEADCGHDVDIEDANDYVEMVGGFITCVPCAGVGG